MDISKAGAIQAADSKPDKEFEAGGAEHLDSDKPPPYVQAKPTEGGRQGLVPPELVAAMTPEQRKTAEKALVRKIDIRLLPMIVLMYIMNYLDRNNIAAARLGALEEDLNLQGNEYAVRFPDGTALMRTSLCCH